MFFQIHKDGQAVDGSSYPSLEQAAADLEKSEQGGQVAEVDAWDRSYAATRCTNAVLLAGGPRPICKMWIVDVVRPCALKTPSNE